MTTRQDISNAQWRRSFICDYLKAKAPGGETSTLSILERMNEELVRLGRKEVKKRTVNADLEYLRDKLSAPLKCLRPTTKGELVIYYWQLTDPSWQLNNFTISVEDVELVEKAIQICSMFHFNDLSKGLQSLYQDKLFPVAGSPPGPGSRRYRFFNDGTQVLEVYPILEELIVLTTVGRRKITFTALSDLPQERMQYERLLPYRVAHIRSDWYLVTSTSDQDATPRMFRVSQIQDLVTEWANTNRPADLEIDDWIRKTHNL